MLSAYTTNRALTMADQVPASRSVVGLRRMGTASPDTFVCSDLL